MTDSEYLGGGDKSGNGPADFVADKGIGSPIAEWWVDWECVKSAAEYEGLTLTFLNHNQPP